MVLFVLVVVGLCMGSFVNALVWRLHEQSKILAKPKRTKADVSRLKRLSIAKGRSMCLSCGHELALRDLVPVLSWMALRGKCRYCGAKIPDSPLAEVVVPLLWVLSYAWWPRTMGGTINILLFGLWLAAMVLFVALALYDLRWYLLPDVVVYPLIGLAVAWRILLALANGSDWLHTLAAGAWGVVVLYGLFYLLYQLSNGRWIGGGDVKLAVALGLFTGGPLAALLLLFIASAAGSLASLPMLVSRQKLRGVHIPFGPFLLAGAYLTVLWGASILGWYNSLLSP